MARAADVLLPMQIQRGVEIDDRRCAVPATRGHSAAVKNSPEEGGRFRAALATMVTAVREGATTSRRGGVIEGPAELRRRRGDALSRGIGQARGFTSQRDVY